MKRFKRLLLQFGAYAGLTGLGLGAAAGLENGFGADLSRSSRPGLVWETGEQKDPMTDKVSLVATATQDVGGGGRIEATVICTLEDVEFQFVYLHDNNDAAQYKWQGVGRYALISLSYRIDDGAVTSYVSLSEYRNEADIAFLDRTDLTGGEADGTQYGPKNGAPLDELVKAQLLRVQLPLADGRQPVLQIRPQAPGLREFFAACPAARAAN